MHLGTSISILSKFGEMRFFRGFRAKILVIAVTSDFIITLARDRGGIMRPH